MFEPGPTSIFYLGVMGVSALLSAAKVVDVAYERGQGFSKWKKQLALDTIVLSANIALIWYAFSTMPADFARVLGETVDRTLFVLCIAWMFWFISLRGIQFMRVVAGAGQPRSFVADLFSRSDRTAMENITANQYATMGTLGSAIGVPSIVTAGPGSNPKIIMVMAICGLLACLVLHTKGPQTIARHCGRNKNRCSAAARGDGGQVDAPPTRAFRVATVSEPVAGPLAG